MLFSTPSQVVPPPGVCSLGDLSPRWAISGAPIRNTDSPLVVPAKPSQSVNFTAGGCFNMSSGWLCGILFPTLPTNGTISLPWNQTQVQQNTTYFLPAGNVINITYTGSTSNARFVIVEQNPSTHLTETSPIGQVRFKTNRPTRAVPSKIEVDQNAVATILFEYDDPDGDSVQIRITHLPASGQLFQLSDVSLTRGALVTSPSDVTCYCGAVQYQAGTTWGLSAVTITFQVRDFDWEPWSQPANVTIDVNFVNVLPSSTGLFNLTMFEDSELEIQLGTSDPDSSALSVLLTSLPTSGSLPQWDNTSIPTKYSTTKNLIRKPCR
jgi:hypothetical protein